MNYNGALPFIVGPFSSPNFKEALDLPLDALTPDKSQMDDIKKRFRNVQIREIDNKNKS